MYIDGQRCPSGAIAGDVYTHAGGELLCLPLCLRPCPCMAVGLVLPWLDSCLEAAAAVLSWLISRNHIGATHSLAFLRSCRADNNHRPRVIEGYCDKVPAGAHEATVWVSRADGWPDCYTGGESVANNFSPAAPLATRVSSLYPDVLCIAMAVVLVRLRCVADVQLSP